MTVVVAAVAEETVRALPFTRTEKPVTPVAGRIGGLPDSVRETDTVLPLVGTLAEEKMGLLVSGPSL